MTTWTEKTRQSETWTEIPATASGHGFSTGFALRPDFMTAREIWRERERQAEVWTPA